MASDGVIAVRVRTMYEKSDPRVNVTLVGMTFMFAKEERPRLMDLMRILPDMAFRREGSTEIEWCVTTPLVDNETFIAAGWQKGEEAAQLNVLRNIMVQDYAALALAPRLTPELRRKCDELRKTLYGK